MISSLMHTAETLYSFCQRTIQPSSLPITKSVQLDTVILFLRSLPVNKFLSTYTTAWNTVILCASDHEQKSIDDITRDVLIQLVEATIKPWYTRSSVHAAVANATTLCNCIPSPIRTGVVLRELSIIGVSLSSAVTKGLYQPAPSIPLRTPSECLASLLDQLQQEVQSNYNVEQSLVLADVIKRGEEKRLKNDMGIKTMKDFLQNTEMRLRSAGLESLGESASSLLEELESHKLEGPPPTRMLDNIYGRVWESFFNAELVENVPLEVLKSIQMMETEMADIINTMPDELESLVGDSFMIQPKENIPPHWVRADDRLKRFIDLKRPGRLEILELFAKHSSNGQEAIGAFFMAARLLISIQDINPNYFAWTASTRGWYKRDIVPLKGVTKFTANSNHHCSGSGITLAHHPPIDDAPDHFRIVTNRVWDLDMSWETDQPSPNMLALYHGLGYGTGISGHMFMFARLFLDIKARRKEFQIAHAIVGLLMFLAYSGGHTWHEGLQTVNYMEHTIGVGILPEHYHPDQFVSDYAAFISIFDTDTQNDLKQAIQHANNMTVLYRRKHFSLPKTLRK